MPAKVNLRSWNMKEINNNSDTANVATQQDKSFQYLQELAERTVINANEMAETIKQEAQTEAAMIVEKAEAAQKEAARAMEEAKQKASELMSEAQRRSEETVAEANELAGRIKKEAQSEAAAMMQQAEAAQKEAAKVLEEIEEKAQTVQKGANALIEALRNQILSDVEVIRDKLFLPLENVTAEIARGGTAIKERRETILKAAGEPGALASCVPEARPILSKS
jgi:membrane protein involved in colicin uptake